MSRDHGGERRRRGPQLPGVKPGRKRRLRPGLCETAQLLLLTARPADHLQRASRDPAEAPWGSGPSWRRSCSARRDQAAPVPPSAPPAASTTAPWPMTCTPRHTHASPLVPRVSGPRPSVNGRLLRPGLDRTGHLRLTRRFESGRVASPGAPVPSRGSSHGSGRER